MGRNYKVKFSEVYHNLIPFRCSDSMYSYILEVSADNNITKSEFIRKAITHYINYLEGFDHADN